MWQIIALAATGVAVCSLVVAMAKSLVKARRRLALVAEGDSVRAEIAREWAVAARTRSFGIAAIALLWGLVSAALDGQALLALPGLALVGALVAAAYVFGLGETGWRVYARVLLGVDPGTLRASLFRRSGG